MRWRHLPIVAFDTETTGLSPFAGDRIIEFAAVQIFLARDGTVDRVVPESFLINPGIEIPRKVTQITGISDADVREAPPFEERADRIRALLAGAVTVAHNYPFDLGFLTAEFRRLGQHWPEPIAEVDTVDVSMRLFPDAKSHKLGDLAKRLDVVLEGAHRATNDAEACGRCFVELARKHDVDDDLQAMLDWAKAIGRPPEEGPFSEDPAGRVVFAEGPHAGAPVGEHPLHLAWMEKARARGPQGWGWRFPESARRWVRRWLDVRGSGRATQNPKGVHQDDWGLESCIADPRGAGA